MSSIEDRINFVNKLLELDKTIDTTNLFEYLKSNDFFTAPASHKYHHAYEGGLSKHCCEVYMNLTKLKDIMIDHPVDSNVLFILAFGHDLAKCNYYNTYDKNVKEDGVWKTIKAYGFVDNPNDYPHEIESVKRLKSVIPNLDFKIEQAIMYHHGAFNPNMMDKYSDACKYNKFVLMLHTADMMSSSKLEN